MCKGEGEGEREREGEEEEEEEKEEATQQDWQKQGEDRKGLLMG